MSHNRKVLRTATNELGKAKAPAKPKDIIVDPMGQWKYPGQNTRIPGSDITMQGVNYPVFAQPNVGQPQMMYPGQDYQFPGATYVDEFPQMQEGGVSPLEGNLISKVIMNRNKGVDFVDRAYALGANPGTPMFNVPDDEKFGSWMSHKMATGEDDNGQAWMFPTVMNPNNEAITVPNQYADYISSIGYKNATGMIPEENYIETELSDDEIEEYRKGGYIVEDISVPQLTQAQKGISISDPKEYAYRKDMYDDSLKLHQLSYNQMVNLNKLKTPLTNISDGDVNDFKLNKKQFVLENVYSPSSEKLKKITPNITEVQRLFPEQNDFYHKKIKPTKSYDSGRSSLNFLYKKPTQPVYKTEKKSIDPYAHSKTKVIPKVIGIPPDQNEDPTKKYVGANEEMGYDENGNPISSIEHVYETNKLTRGLKSEPNKNEIVPLISRKSNKPSKSDFAYRDQAVYDYDKDTKKFSKDLSRKAPLPYAERYSKGWESNTSKDIPESGPRVWTINGKEYYNQEDANAAANQYEELPSYNFQKGGAYYTYEGRPDAKYKKDTKGNWSISINDKKEFTPIKDKTGKRSLTLNKNAKLFIPGISDTINSSQKALNLEPIQLSNNTVLGDMMNIPQNIAVSALTNNKYTTPSEYLKGEKITNNPYIGAAADLVLDPMNIFIAKSLKYGIPQIPNTINLSKIPKILPGQKGYKTYNNIINPISKFDIITKPTTVKYAKGGIPELPLREGRKAYERLSYTDNDRMAMEEEGGFIEADLTDEEIEEYRRGGYTVNYV